MEPNDEMWGMLKEILGYSDEELALFERNPKIAAMVSKVPELMQKTIVVEVIASHGCASGHKVGDKFILDGAGNLISKQCPNRMCIYALNALAPPIMSAQELFYAGVDPNEMKLNRVSCFDVGVRCGGWGADQHGGQCGGQVLRPSRQF